MGVISLKPGSTRPPLGRLPRVTRAERAPSTDGRGARREAKEEKLQRCNLGDAEQRACAYRGKLHA